MRVFLINELIVFFISCILFSGCSFLNNVPKGPESNKNNQLVEILESNKNEITYIKNRTADDIELGHFVRKAVLDSELSDADVGKLARKWVGRQQHVKDDEFINFLDYFPSWCKWCLLIVVLVVSITLILPFITKKGKC